LWRRPRPKLGCGAKERRKKKKKKKKKKKFIVGIRDNFNTENENFKVRYVLDIADFENVGLRTLLLSGWYSWAIRGRPGYKSLLEVGFPV
jgi:hypothetical protein